VVELNANMLFLKQTIYTYNIHVLLLLFGLVGYDAAPECLCNLVIILLGSNPGSRIFIFFMQFPYMGSPGIMH
jgi:hypothetical protein